MLLTLLRLRQTILAQQAYFTSREKGYCSRLLHWCDYSQPTHQPDLYITYLRSLSLVNYKTECRFLIRLYQEAGFSISSFQSRHWLRYNPPPPCSDSNELLLFSELSSSYNNLTGLEKLGFYILAGTGRRSCDINRLIFLSEESNCNQLLFRLPSQKNGLKNALVVLYFDECELSCPLPYAEVFEILSRGSLSLNWDRIRRRARIRLHSLRKRFAIRLLLRGNSEERISERLGWLDCRSLRRYVKLSFEFISQQQDADAVVSMVRSLK